ncbi:translocon-associated protein subunit alpha-like [Acanthaster planci]|uniref:Translocon-associated protein subunit alpha n=1 Tax=Acanthaster planci TaxID=133434 RepID=A0A8B7XJJ1_ACAPL|nr:translocon-associated protein subunit alpha-like [Acanthaster planci]
MFKIVPKFILLLMLVLPASVLLSNRASLVADAEEDTVEDVLEGEEIEDEEEDEEDDEDGQIETEEEGGGGAGEEKTAAAKTGEEEAEEEDEQEQLKAAEDVETTLLFTKNADKEIPVNKLIQILVGFTNNGKQNYMVENIHASLRYPQDFSYYIQNFTSREYNTLIEPGKEATLEYIFQASESLALRPFGFVMELHYKDAEGNPFMDAVFNDTVQFIEQDEGLDTETFFLYVFLVALVVLLVVGAQQLVVSLGKKRKVAKPVVETGTQNHTDIDYDWIPKENIAVKKSPSPRKSPRRRTAKRATGSGDE